MRQTVVGGLTAAVGVVGAIVLERLMDQAPSWIWGMTAAASAVGGLLVVLLSDTLQRVLAPASRRRPILSVLVVGAICAAVGSLAWWIVVVRVPAAASTESATEGPAPSPPAPEPQHVAMQASDSAGAEVQEELQLPKDVPVQDNRSPESPSQPTVSQQTSGASSPIVNQTGQNNIAQIGNNNQATIVSPPARSLSAAAQDAMVVALSAFRGTLVGISLGQGSEPQHFGQQIVTVLERAGWGGEVTQAMFVGVTPKGLILHSAPSGRRAASALAEELRSQGIPVENSETETVFTAKHSVTVAVGTLPATP